MGKPEGMRPHRRPVKGLRAILKLLWRNRLGVILVNNQGTYNYTTETNCVPREYSVAAVLLLLFMVPISLIPVLNLLYFYTSTFRSMCAVPNMAVFCSSWTSYFPGMLLTRFWNDFEILLSSSSSSSSSSSRRSELSKRFLASVYRLSSHTDSSLCWYFS